MQLKSKLIFSASMFAFGTIGIIRRFIPLPSGFLCVARGLIGALFLSAFMLLTKRRPDFPALKSNAFKLVVSGILMGANWILLFESYSYTTVATATLCYYMSPVIVLLVSPFLFKEFPGVRGFLCIAASVFGMALVSGVISGGFSLKKDGKGIILGLCAAVLYAGVIMINKTITDLKPYDKTVVQLLSAAIITSFYVAFAETVKKSDFSLVSVLLVICLGVVHTGICYAGYFGTIDKLSSRSIAVLSYIDPVVAVLLSSLLLKEKMTAAGIVGAVLIIGSAIISELPQRVKKIKE